MEKLKIVSALIVTIVFWASAFTGIRAGLEAYTPEHLAVLRFLVTSILIFIVATVIRMKPPKWQDLGGLTIASLLGISLYHIALNAGEVTVHAATAGFLINTSPVFIALLSAWFFKDRLRFWGWFGAGISFVGVSLICLSKGPRFELEPGALLILGAAFMFSLSVMFQRKYLRTYSALALSSYMILIGSVFFLPFAPGLSEAIQTAPFKATLAIVYLGVFPGGISYITWAYCLTKIPSSQLGSFLYISPVLGTFIAWLWLREIPTTLALLGGPVVILGVWIVNSYGKVRLK